MNEAEFCSGFANTTVPCSMEGTLIAAVALCLFLLGVRIYLGLGWVK